MNECPECEIDLNWITDTDEVVDVSKNEIYCSMDCIRETLRQREENDIEEYIQTNVKYI